MIILFKLNETEKKSVLEMLKAFITSRKENTERIDIEQYNKEIDQAMNDIKKGKVHSHEEVAKIAKNW
jgi:hypothetical protein